MLLHFIIAQMGGGGHRIVGDAPVITGPPANSIAIGNSNTAGGLVDTPYPEALSALLNPTYFITPVVNKGGGGTGVNYALENLSLYSDELVEDVMNIAIVDYGTNNLSGQVPAEVVTMAELKAGYQELIEELVAMGYQVICIAPGEPGRNVGAPKAQIYDDTLEFRNHIEDNYVAWGAKGFLSLLDYPETAWFTEDLPAFDNFITDPGYDNIHYNDAGQAFIASKIYLAIMAVRAGLTYNSNTSPL